ncbi:MAG TPA: hypothetical protein VEA59_04980, partial [Patescibacteria group bacterium]|nr:hypothetical protein [Patescibacteria group bacterium]
METFRYLWKNLDHLRGRFVFAFVSGMAGGICGFYIPYFLAKFSAAGLTTENLWRVLWFLGLCWIGILVTSWVIRTYGEVTGVHFKNHLKSKFFKQLEA